MIPSTQQTAKPTVTREMTYRGRTVATVSTVERQGLNYRVSFTNGYSVVAAESMIAADVLSMVA